MFFKTSPGHYSHQDVFIGVTTPELRSIAKRFQTCSLADISQLLHESIHEVRSIALMLLVQKYRSADSALKKQCIDLYFQEVSHVNNWDLVDSSAYQLLGDSLLHISDRSILYTFAHSKNMWENRIAIIATFAFIKNHDFTDALRISEILLLHPHDLLHKAVGWMLREVGKKNQRVLEDFLHAHYKTMSRTTLRYAIEKFTPDKRKYYMQLS